VSLDMCHVCVSVIRCHVCQCHYVWRVSVSSASGWRWAHMSGTGMSSMLGITNTRCTNKHHTHIQSLLPVIVTIRQYLQLMYYAKMILMAPLHRTGERPPGRPCVTWLNTIQQDPRAYNRTLNEAVNMAQNCPLWRLICTYGATHS